MNLNKSRLNLKKIRMDNLKILSNKEMTEYLIMNTNASVNLSIESEVEKTILIEKICLKDNDTAYISSIGDGYFNETFYLTMPKNYPFKFYLSDLEEDVIKKVGQFIINLEYYHINNSVHYLDSLIRKVFKSEEAFAGKRVIFINTDISNYLNSEYEAN